MSLPPLNPSKTAAGIIIDPRTLERVVPSSRRNDGTTRKELKIRPGFTPTEDIGRFRPPASSSTSSTPTFIPGSNRIKPPPKSDVINPFARVEVDDNKEKSKAQLKNQKRRAAKAKKVVEVEGEGKDWDEDVDGDEEVGGLREAFERVDLAKAGEMEGDEAEGVEAGGEITNVGGAPASSALVNESNGDESVGLDILVPTPGSGISSANELNTPIIKNTKPTDPNPLTSTSTSTSTPTVPRPTQTQTQKSHPIQGGRKGPIGLANPPPMPAPTPKASDNSTWRKTGTNGSKGVGKGNSGVELLPTPVQPEVRVRKEVRVRQGGANDLSSLASRVRGLVLENEKGRGSPRNVGEKAV